MTVEKNQKNRSIFAIWSCSVVSELSMGLCPIWLIDAFFYRMLEVLNVLGLIDVEIGAAY